MHKFPSRSISPKAPRWFIPRSPPRLLGSYSDLHYGFLEDALVDLMGGVITNIHLHSSPVDLVKAVKTAIKAGSLITCATPSEVSQRGALLHQFKPFLSQECSARGAFS